MDKLKDGSFIFVNGPINGGKEDIVFESGKIEIHDKGDKIFFSSGVKLIISKKQD